MIKGEIVLQLCKRHIGKYVFKILANFQTEQFFFHCSSSSCSYKKIYFLIYSLFLCFDPLLNLLYGSLNYL